ncbi:MAG: ATP-binding cassette domain-containing protein [Micrococcaceae bacterium]
MSQTTNTILKLEINNVTVAYDNTKEILSDFSFIISRNGLFQLKGKNGSGKTTILELISGHLLPTKGRVKVLGKNAQELTLSDSRRICRTNMALFPYINVIDHLQIFSKWAGTPLEFTVERAKKYKLEEWFHTPTLELSEGTKKKLWIILTTLGEFELLVLDEPFETLDHRSKELLKTEIENWKKEKVVLLITHSEHKLELTGAFSL